MQASGTATKASTGARAKAEDPTPQARETAARLGALLRYVVLFDQGEHLRAIDESGLTMSQVKALLLLRGAEGAPRPVSEIADALGLSVAAMSRAVEGLVKKRLVTRVTDAQDRRVRLVAASQKGQALANELMASRMAGIESFTETLSAAQRRRIDAAVDALFDRDEIASAYKQLKAVAK